MAIARIKRWFGRLRDAASDRDLVGLLVLLDRLVPDFLLVIRADVVTHAPARFRLPAFRPSKNSVSRRLEKTDGSSLEFADGMEEGSPEELRDRFHGYLAAGHDGFVAEVRNTVVAYSWVTYDVCSIPEVRFERPLESGEAHSLRSYVHPDHRFSKIYLELMRLMSDRLVDRGIRSCFGHTDYLNKHSVRTHGRMGYRVIGTIVLMEIPFFYIQIQRFDREMGGQRWFVRRKRKTRQPSVESSPHRSRGGVLTI